MSETVYKVERELSAHFWMRNRHDRPSDADIQAQGMKYAESKATTEDIGFVQSFVPNAKFHHVEYIRYDNLDIDQHQTIGTNERHWQAEGDCIYNLYYTQ